MNLKKYFKAKKNKDFYTLKKLLVNDFNELFSLSSSSLDSFIKLSLSIYNNEDTKIDVTSLTEISKTISYSITSIPYFEKKIKNNKLTDLLKASYYAELVIQNILLTTRLKELQNPIFLDAKFVELNDNNNYRNSYGNLYTNVLWTHASSFLVLTLKDVIYITGYTASFLKCEINEPSELLLTEITKLSYITDDFPYFKIDFKNHSKDIVRNTNLGIHLYETLKNYASTHSIEVIEIP